MNENVNRGSQEQQAQPSPEIRTESWYPNSVTSSSASSSRPATPPSFSPASPAEAAGIIPHLNDKRCSTISPFNYLCIAFVCM